MKILIYWVVINICYSIRDFIFNVVFWMIRVHRLRRALKTKRELKRRVLNMDGVEILLSFFKWSRGGWCPWKITCFCGVFEENQRGSPDLIRWALKQIGIKASVYALVNGDKIEQIVVTEDTKSLMFNRPLVRAFDICYWDGAVLRSHYNSLRHDFDFYIKKI